MERLADFIIDKRNILLIVIILLTAFFGYQASTMQVKTIFPDLLPQQHPYIDVHNEVRNVFGGANQVLVMVQVKTPERGGTYKDIFNPDTLDKVKFITDELRKFNAVGAHATTEREEAERLIDSLSWLETIRGDTEEFPRLRVVGQ